MQLALHACCAQRPALVCSASGPWQGASGAVSSLSLAQLYAGQLLLSDVQHVVLTATAQVCLSLQPCFLSPSYLLPAPSYLLPTSFLLHAFLMFELDIELELESA